MRIKQLNPVLGFVVIPMLSSFTSLLLGSPVNEKETCRGVSRTPSNIKIDRTIDLGF
jgi:hypothetical protein